MEKFSVLTAALGFIEDNIREDIDKEDIARCCAYSLSSVEKMFRQVFHIGIADYITRRKITCASKDLLMTDDNILDIAVRYGYNSHEVFSRAFCRIWGETPNMYRKKRSFSEIFPPLDVKLNLEIYTGDVIMSGKKFDVTELYDQIKQRDGICVLSFDVVDLMAVNANYGHKAGDIAIAECIKRIDSEADGDMIMFRIGGDEFVLITDTKDMNAAREIGDRIIAKNGSCISFEGRDIPVSLRYGVMTIDGKRNIRYGDLFTELVKVGRDNEAK